MGNVTVSSCFTFAFPGSVWTLATAVPGTWATHVRPVCPASWGLAFPGPALTAFTHGSGPGGARLRCVARSGAGGSRAGHIRNSRTSPLPACSAVASLGLGALLP